MVDVIRELRHGARRLRRAPVFSFTTVVVLALGIGATTSVFTLVDGILIRPLRFPQPERLVDLSHNVSVSGAPHINQSDATFLLYQRHATAFTSIAAYRESAVTLGAIEGSAQDAERLSASGVTASFFKTLGVAPLKGRPFSEDEDKPNGSPVVIISDALWNRTFGGDKNIVGKRVSIDGRSTEIVGVMSPDFHFPDAGTKLWMPLQLDPAHTRDGSFNYTGVGRLKPGVTTSSAAAELDRLSPRTLDEFPDYIPKAMWEQAHLRAVITPLRDTMVGDVSHLLWILMGAVGLVLVIACANVANLFLVRAEGRQRELAVRSALGAAKSVIAAQLLAESAIVAAIGGAIGLALAFLGVKALSALPAGIDLPRLTEVGVDGEALLFALGATLLGTLIVSVVPLIRLRRIAISTVLRESDRSATTGAARQRTRSTFVVVQVAMALVLVASSGLMARSFARLRGVRPGFDPTGVLTLRVAFPAARYADAASRMPAVDEIVSGVRAIPSVRTVGVTDWLPLSDDRNNSTTEVEDQPLPPNTVPPVHDVASVTGDYFAAMGIPLATGRTFGAIDPAKPPLEAIVTQAYARRYWKSASPLGKRLRPDIQGPWYTIVGVAADSHLESLDTPPEEAVYLPLVQSQRDSTYMSSEVALVVRTRSADPTSVASGVRRVVHDVDAALPIYEEQPLAAMVVSAFARTRFVMLLLALASGIALVLGAVGIYGVMAYGVSLRRREIGVRLALGARPSDVSWMVSRQGLALGGIGVVAGLVAAIGVTRVLRGLLYGVSPADPVTLTAAAAALLAVSLAASWVPARRAATVDPAESLRSE